MAEVTNPFAQRLRELGAGWSPLKEVPGGFYHWFEEGRIRARCGRVWKGERPREGVAVPRGHCCLRCWKLRFKDHVHD